MHREYIKENPFKNEREDERSEACRTPPVGVHKGAAGSADKQADTEEFITCCSELLDHLLKLTFERG